jgi:hypothetical protein
VYQRVRRTDCIHLPLHCRRRQMVPLKRQETYTRLHSVIYQKKAITITRNGWQTRVLGRNLTAGKFKISLGKTLLTCQDHLQVRKLLRSSFESFHCVLLTALLWEISGTLQLQKKIPNNTPGTRGGTRVLTVCNANITARLSNTLSVLFDHSGKVKHNSSTFVT